MALGLIAGFYFYKQKQTYITKCRSILASDFLKKPKPYIPKEALKEMPEPAKEHYIKGQEYYYQKDFDKAISEYKESIKIKPTAQAYCELALSYMEKGDFTRGIENLKESIALNSQYPKAEYALAVCYARINPPDIKLAREHFEKSKQLRYHAPEWFEKYLKKLEGQKE